MHYPVAYQLYSSRHFPPLAQHFPILKALGYAAIEPWLPAYEADPKQFWQQLDDAGLACYGFHMPLQGLIKDTNRYIDIALQLGATYMIPPFIAEEERQATTQYWQCLGEQLAEKAQRVSADGLKVVWHNHDFEYVALPDGSRPIDHILGASPDVFLELDCGWATRAGADLAVELARYREQIAIIQLKDTAPVGTVEEDGWTATGDGIIDWESLIPLFRSTRADHIVAEHDNPANWQIFAQRSILYMQSIGLSASH